MKKSKSNLTKKQNDDDGHKSREFSVKPTLYSSIIQTEMKLRDISLSRIEPKPITNKIGVRELNFPLTKQVYDYKNMVDVGLNSGTKVIAKPKSKEVCSTKKPEPKLSDYYQPSFDNVQRIQMEEVKITPELTMQYDGLAVSRLLHEIDDLVFR